MEETKEVVTEEKGKLAKFFDNKAVKLVESALLVGLAAGMIMMGIPADFTSMVVLGIASVAGIDGIATFIDAITRKKKDAATEVN